MFEKSAADNRARQAAVLASCPVKEGEVLNEVKLQYADTGKDVKGDYNEMDNGAFWKLPPVKGRPVRKVVMNCLYRRTGEAEGDNNGGRAAVLVPSAAQSCQFDVQRNAVRSTPAYYATTLHTTSVRPAPVPGELSQNTNAPATMPNANQNATAAQPGLGDGPTAPVNRLNVRGISVRMGRAQILAAKATNMRVLINGAKELKLVDPTASGKPVRGMSGPGGSGLVLLISLVDDIATEVIISEQGALNGEVLQIFVRNEASRPTCRTATPRNSGLATRPDGVIR